MIKTFTCAGKRPGALLLAALLSGAAVFLATCARAQEAPEALAARGDLAYRRGDVVDALRWYRRAAEAGHARAQARLAFVLEKAGEQEESVAWYRKSAEQGDAEGQHGLAMKYASGEGVPRDPAQMLYWLEQAARQDHAQSVLSLARTLEGGSADVAADPSAALGYWRRAAQLGDHGAMLRLAKAYRKGELGLAVDPEEARRWEERFAEATRTPKPAKP